MESKKQYQIERLASLTRDIHKMERTYKETHYAEGDVPLKFDPIDEQIEAGMEYFPRIVAHLEHARMYSGDLLRLAVLGKDHRTNTYFNPAVHNGRYNGEIEKYATPLDFISWAKAYLRDLLYSICDEITDDNSYLDMPDDVNVYEWNMYIMSLRQHLKEADQCLGLWLCEIGATKQKN